MEEIEKLFDKMEDDLKSKLTFNEKDGFWYDEDDVCYTEEGISLVVYEDFKDSINILFNSRC
jgi:hypothetical protein